MGSRFIEKFKNIYQQQNVPDLVVRAYNPSTREVEAGCSQIQGYLGSHCEILPQTNKQRNPQHNV
jgi:hypothetical protein